jgi:hypothetical protein
VSYVLSKGLQFRVGTGQFLAIPPLFLFGRPPSADFAGVQYDGVYIWFMQQVGSCALYPALFSVFPADSRVQLERTFRLLDHLLQGLSGLLTILRMDQL